jgi:hypothetical protein
MGFVRTSLRLSAQDAIHLLCDRDPEVTNLAGVNGLEPDAASVRR